LNSILSELQIFFDLGLSCFISQIMAQINCCPKAVLKTFLSSTTFVLVKIQVPIWNFEFQLVKVQSKIS